MEKVWASLGFDSTTHKQHAKRFVDRVVRCCSREVQRFEQMLADTELQHAALFALLERYDPASANALPCTEPLLARMTRLSKALEEYHNHCTCKLCDLLVKLY